MTEPGRFPSATDVFGYDFVPYIVGMLLCWAIISIINICIFKYKTKKGIYVPYVREIPKNEYLIQKNIYNLIMQFDCK